MENLIDNRFQKEQEDFKTDFENFISDWTKKAEELENREIDNENSNNILRNYRNAENGFYIFRKAFKLSLSDQRKLESTASKLRNSLAIARSNYRSKHLTWWERLIDRFGININK